MKPTRPIDVMNRGQNWKPTPAAKTDVAATFRAARKRMEDERVKTSKKVLTIKKANT